MGAPVVHFEIIGGEGDELEKFYDELFGWKINSNNPMKYGTVDTSGGPGGNNGGVGPARDGKGRVSVYAQVNDLQAMLDRAEKLGGKTILPPSWLFMAYLASRRAVIGVHRAFTGSC